MRAAGLPPLEAERLADFRDCGVLDTPSGKILNGITELAAETIGV